MNCHIQCECGNVEVVSEDSRRVISEYDGTDFGWAQITVVNKSTLGQHYHRNKTEEFFFLCGSGTIRVAPVNKKGAIVGAPSFFAVQPGFVISVLPFHVHRLDLAKGTKFVVRSSAPFDADDLHGCEI